MTFYIDAIYDNGVLNPVEPLRLPDQARVRLQIDVDDSPPSGTHPDGEGLAEEVRRQREAARQLDEELADLPDPIPEDGFTSADHDRILYGEGM
jgi:predicted DNA-binding antitoxin AbrB/MazE fold protein